MASFFGFARKSTVAPLLTSRADNPVRRRQPDAHEMATLIEAEIIPRMVALSRPPLPMVDRASQNPLISGQDVDSVVPLAVSLEADALMDAVDRLLARGVTVETLLVDLLAPVARRLGQLWEDDRCDFLDVTLGVWRLQEVVHELAARRADRAALLTPVRRALVTSAPGDSHSFGVIVIEQLFEEAGWHADRLAPETDAEIVRCIANDWYDVVALTVACDCHMAPLPAMILALRKASRNPDVRVLVGGSALAGKAGLPESIGADGSAVDGRDAVALANGLVDAATRSGGTAA